MTGDPEDIDVRKKTLTSVMQRMEAMAVKHTSMARKDNDKGRTVMAAQHSYAASVLRDEIEWLKTMRRKASD